MFELSLIKLQTKKNDESDNETEETFTIGLFIFVLLYFIILLWALVRVFICSRELVLCFWLLAYNDTSCEISW